MSVGMFACLTASVLPLPLLYWSWIVDLQKCHLHNCYLFQNTPRSYIFYFQFSLPTVTPLASLPGMLQLQRYGVNLHFYSRVHVSVWCDLPVPVYHVGENVGCLLFLWNGWAIYWNECNVWDKWWDGWMDYLLE